MDDLKAKIEALPTCSSGCGYVSLKSVLTLIATHDAETAPTGKTVWPSVRDAAITLRCPEGFTALAEALGMSETSENRGRLDEALKSVIGGQK